MRKRTFEDRKFSAGDANSQAYRDNWDATFGEQEPKPEPKCNCGAELSKTHNYEHPGVCCDCFDYYWVADDD